MSKAKKSKATESVDVAMVDVGNEVVQEYVDPHPIILIERLQEFGINAGEI